MIRFTALLLIALVALTPQKAFCQFSEATIREINERLLELHECREKQSLYEILAVNDGLTIHRQDSIIQKLTIDTNKEKVAKTRYQNITAVTTLLLILAVIL